ncbi:MAG: 2-oxoacid:ferredoxin oxidoreductase subunit beta, partial [Desulfuromonadaceae bacterium]|nr:2-oxoacid:ferredoxin oxidoreductase subunit beta [Desulfuromonadaceae bacterium]
MAFDYDKYLRPGKLPHIWCPGCGHGIVMKGLIRAMDTLNLK